MFDIQSNVNFDSSVPILFQNIVQDLNFEEDIIWKINLQMHWCAYHYKYFEYILFLLHFLWNTKSSLLLIHVSLNAMAMKIQISTECCNLQNKECIMHYSHTLHVSTLNKSSTEWLWIYSFKSYYCKSKMSAKISDMIKNKALLSHYVLLKIIRYKFLDLSLSIESARLLFCSLKALHAFWFFIDHMVLSIAVSLHIIYENIHKYKIIMHI